MMLGRYPFTFAPAVALGAGRVCLGGTAGAAQQATVHPDVQQARVSGVECRQCKQDKQGLAALPSLGPFLTTHHVNNCYLQQEHTQSSLHAAAGKACSVCLTAPQSANPKSCAGRSAWQVPGAPCQHP